MLKRNIRGGVPSPYQRWWFHGLRSAQLISSLVVSAIMGYFMYFLRKCPLNLPQHTHTASNGWDNKLLGKTDGGKTQD